MVCNICLEAMESPVVTPCGHVFCLECLIISSQKSPDAMQAPCPTCRATFSLVSPHSAFVPEKYRRFIDSNIRRVYLDDAQDAALQDKILQLESRIKSLETDKSLLIARCETHMAAATFHSQKEKDARVKCASLQQELKHANYCVAQLVEKSTHKHTTGNSSAPPTHPFHAGVSSSNIPFLPRSDQLGKRGSFTAKEQASSKSVHAGSGDSRPAVPLPKRRRVSRKAVSLV